MAALYNSCHVGSGIAASLPGLQGSAGVPGYCDSAKITIARSKLSAFSRSCGRIIRHETDPKECGLEVSMARVLTWVSDQHLTGWACSARATGIFRFLRFSAILRQRRLTTDSPRPR